MSEDVFGNGMEHVLNEAQAGTRQARSIAVDVDTHLDVPAVTHCGRASPSSLAPFYSADEGINQLSRRRTVRACNFHFTSPMIPVLVAVVPKAKGARVTG